MKSLRISWSSLLNFEKCQVMGYKQLARVPAPPQNVRNFFHGTVADVTMRKWLNVGAEPGTMADMIQDVLVSEEEKILTGGRSKLTWKSPTDRAEVLEYLRRLATDLEPILLEKVVPYTHECGRWLRVPLKVAGLDDAAEVTLVGEMDLFVTHEDGYCEFDLKATADPYYWKKSLGQHFFYALLIWGKYGVLPKETGFIQPMCPQKYVPVAVTKEQVGELLTRVIRMANTLCREEESFPEHTKYCNEFNCKWRPNCERFSVKEISW